MKEILINIFHLFLTWKDKEAKDVKANSVKIKIKTNKNIKQNIFHLTHKGKYYRITSYLAV